jgi:hypothetical protein
VTDWREKLLLSWKARYPSLEFRCRPCLTASHDMPKSQRCVAGWPLLCFQFPPFHRCDTSRYKWILSRAWLQFLWSLSRCCLKLSTAASLLFPQSTYVWFNVPSIFLQLRGPATALSRKFLHYLTTARHFKSFFVICIVRIFRLEIEKFQPRGNNPVCAGGFQLLLGRAPAQLRGNTGVV